MFLTADNYLKNIVDLQEQSETIDIAVAFWGKGAEQLIPLTGKKLRILCNLAMGGTNPEVIEKLKTYPSVTIQALNHLHAKVVIGSRKAIIGSANFSANGLNFEGEELSGWREAGYQVSAPEQLEEMRAWFEKCWAESDVITPPMIADAKRLWSQRSASRGVSQDKPKQLLQMPLESLERRDIVVVIWRDRISEQAVHVLESKKSTMPAPDVAATLGCYENWPEDLSIGQKVIDIYIGKRGSVEVKGLFEIIGEDSFTDDEGETTCIHISRSIDELFGIPEAELLEGLKEAVKDAWIELFKKDDGDVSQVLPVREFVSKLRAR